MTIEQLKELLSTYGVNAEEREAPVLVSVNGVLTPVSMGEVDYTPWDEGNRPFVVLHLND